MARVNASRYYQRRRLRVEWKPQDCWVGVFWKRTPHPLLTSGYVLDVWVCLLPMVPIRFESRTGRRPLTSAHHATGVSERPYGQL